MSDLIHCHTARQLQASAIRVFAPSLGSTVAALTLALAACGGGDIDAPIAVETAPSQEQREAEAADPAYFPSQFPAPEGDIEPLPEQF